MEDVKGDVNDRVFKRKLEGIILGIDELSTELKKTKEALLTGGKIRFATKDVVGELQDIIREIEDARLEEYIESFPPNKGPAT